jgi:hypothetical protein
MALALTIMYDRNMYKRSGSPYPGGPIFTFLSSRVLVNKSTHWNKILYLIACGSIAATIPDHYGSCS